MIPSRPYQAQACSCISQGLSEYNRVLCEMATGTGKSYTLAMWMNQTPGRHLVIVTGDDLIGQLVESIEHVTGEHVGIERAGETAHDCFSRFVVASVPSLAKDKRLARYVASHFDFIHIDEGHMAAADGYVKVCAHFKSKMILWTATGYRADKKSLPYDFVSFRYPYRQAVQDGWLVPCVFERIPIRIDARKVGMSKGDYDLGQLDHAIEPYLEAVAREIATRPDKRHLVFLPLVNTSLKMTGILKGLGMRPMHVDGTMKDRKWIKDALESHEFNVVCNAQVFSVGTDIPSADCLTILRLTKSLGRYVQTCGRVLRPLTDVVPALNAATDEAARSTIIAESSKPFSTILDPLWLTKRMDICNPPDLVAATPQEAQIIKSAYAASGKINLSKAIVIAEDTIKRNGNSIVKEMQSHSHKEREVEHVNLKFYGIDTNEYRARFSWESLAPSDKQREWLSKQKVDANGMTRGKAHYIMEKIIKSDKPSPAMIEVLRRAGVNGYKLSREEASKKIDTIAKRWKK